MINNYDDWILNLKIGDTAIAAYCFKKQPRKVTVKRITPKNWIVTDIGTFAPLISMIMSILNCINIGGVYSGLCLYPPTSELFEMIEKLAIKRQNDMVIHKEVRNCYKLYNEIIDMPLELAKFINKVCDENDNTKLS